MDIQAQRQETQDKFQSDIRLPETDNPQLPPDIPSDLSGRYYLIKKIGHGSQGKVYLANRESDGMPVAIKVLQINSIKNWKEYDLFWREVNTLKSLDLEGVAKFYEVIEQLDCPKPCAYLVQQYIKGQSIADMIRAGYRFNVKTVFEIAIQLVNILEQLHHHDPPIIHRDIKPSNIMIETNNDGFKVYLTDFGAVANPLLQKGGSTVAGTYGYMPPEQLMGKPEPASDIYALGATLAGILAGMEPADMEVAEYRLAIEKPLESLPYPIVSCLRMMTQPKIEARLYDYAQLRTIFKQFTEGKFFEIKNTALSFKSKRSFYKRLKSVHSIGQQENFELWEMLPEKTPRPLSLIWSMPYKFQKKIRYSLYSNRLIPLLSPAFMLYAPLRWILHFLFIASLVIMFLGFIPLGIWGYNNGGDNFAIVVIATTIFVLFPINIMILTNFIHSIKIDFGKGKKAYYHLLRKGRKSLATITDIKYIGAGDFVPFYLNHKIFSNTMKDAGTERNCYYAGYNPYYPRIRITYAFNPPDDSSEDNLIHSVIVPADSEKYIKVGDLLPILYTIDKMNNSIVNSMPFPLPVSDPMVPSEMICVNQNYK